MAAVQRARYKESTTARCTVQPRRITMRPDEPDTHASRDTFLAIMLCLLVGIPLFVFFNVITFGLFLFMLGGAVGVGVLAGFHYLLWGRSFNASVAGEREEEELRADIGD